MLNRAPFPVRWLVVGLSLAVTAGAAAQPPAEPSARLPRPERAGPLRNARPLPSGAERGAGPKHDVAERIRDRREAIRMRVEQRERIRTLSRELDEALARRNAAPAEIREKVERLAALRAERRREHRFELRRRFGAAVATPEVKSELELHARRMARLRRAQIVAATERTGKPRAALLERVERLIQRENERHDQVMTKLVPDQRPPRAQPLASASAPGRAAGSAVPGSAAPGRPATPPRTPAAPRATPAPAAAPSGGQP